MDLVFLVIKAMLILTVILGVLMYVGYRKIEKRRKAREAGTYVGRSDIRGYRS